MVPGFSLTQLTYLAAVAEHGSIAAAAQTAHVSQAAISTAIQDLERRLGVELLSRRPGHRVGLTDTGAAVLADARRVLEASEQLVRRVKAPHMELTGSLRLGFFTTLSPTYLAPLLAQFAAEHPWLDLSVTEGSQEELKHALHDGSCELVITYRQGIGKTLATQRIGRLQPYALLAADHPLAARHELRARDLANIPLIGYALDDHSSEKVLKSLGYTPTTVHRSSNIEVVRNLVGRGLGWSMMYQRWPNGVSGEGRLLAGVPLSDEFSDLDVVAGWSPREHVSRKSAAVISFLRGVHAGTASPTIARVTLPV